MGQIRLERLWVRIPSGQLYNNKTKQNNNMGLPAEYEEVKTAKKIIHSEMVAALVKSGELIKQELTNDQAHLWHMVTGVAGEAGELLDAIKKNCIYQKPLDRENVIEELGDLEFYMEGVRAAVGVTRQETLDANIAKLSKRYEGLKYSNSAAIDRADKS